MRHLWLVGFLLAGCASAVPLPFKVTVVPPVGVPQELAAFSGKWQGVWDGTLDHILVVEEITENEAIVIYAWGSSVNPQITPGFRRTSATFEGNSLVVNLPRPATVRYRMRPDGKLDARYEWSGGLARAVMTKVAKTK